MINGNLNPTPEDVKREKKHYFYLYETCKHDANTSKYKY